MKFFFLFFLIPAFSFAQYEPFPSIDNKVNYTSIFDVEGSSKEKLFSKIKDWAVDAYKSEKTTLQAEDKEAGYIAYKGYIPVNSYYTGGLLKGKPYIINVYHTLKFYIKDEKVKIVFTDLEVQSLDIGRMMAVKNNISLIEPVPVESGFREINGKVTKQRKAYLEYTFDNIHIGISSFMKSIENHIVSGISEFDF
jgi:hypothetical protein